MVIKSQLSWLRSTLRLRYLSYALCLLTYAFGPQIPAHAQGAQPVRLIVPYAAGGPITSQPARWPSGSRTPWGR